MSEETFFNRFLATVSYISEQFYSHVTHDDKKDNDACDKIWESWIDVYGTVKPHCVELRNKKDVGKRDTSADELVYDHNYGLLVRTVPLYGSEADLDNQCRQHGNIIWKALCG